VILVKLLAEWELTLKAKEDEGHRKSPYKGALNGASPFLG
jgi:hypothetical protein